MERSDVRQLGMADMVCVLRGHRDTNVQLLIEDMQQWNSEGYNLNLTNFIVTKINSK
jgi:hypothetical protein